jgi:hypothetical protein
VALLAPTVRRPCSSSIVSLGIRKALNLPPTIPIEPAGQPPKPSLGRRAEAGIPIPATLGEASDIPAGCFARVWR